MNSRIQLTSLALSLSFATAALLSGCQAQGTEGTIQHPSSYSSGSTTLSTDTRGHTVPASMTRDGGMAAHCKDLKEQSERLMSDMKAQDAALAEQLAVMNSASDETKLKLLAAVVTRLVEQRAALDGRIETLHHSVMQHMSEHMQSGKDSMSQCPMMKAGGSAPAEAYKTSP